MAQFYIFIFSAIWDKCILDFVWSGVYVCVFGAQHTYLLYGEMAVRSVYYVDRLRQHTAIFTAANLASFQIQKCCCCFFVFFPLKIYIFWCLLEGVCNKYPQSLF